MAKVWLVVLTIVAMVNCPLDAQESADTLDCDVHKTLDLSTIEYLPGKLTLMIKEGNDELVDQLRLASEQDRVKIGRPSWDELSADLGLIRIEAFSDYTELGRRLFLLVFPEESDLQQFIVCYCALPYVEYATINEVLRTAITQATWGVVKHCRSDSRCIQAIEDKN